MAFCLTACLAACTNAEQSRYQAVDANGWPYGSELTFDFGNADIDKADIAIAVRHSTDYEYADLALELNYATKSGEATDTIKLMLADSYGRWMGKGVGVAHQYVGTVRRNVDIDLSRPVKLRNLMKTDTLRHIEQMGVIIKPSDYPNSH